MPDVIDHDIKTALAYQAIYETPQLFSFAW
jgi:hypothetical protein